MNIDNIFQSNTEYLNALIEIMNVKIVNYFENVYSNQKITETPFEKYKGIAISKEEIEDIMESFNTSIVWDEELVTLLDNWREITDIKANESIDKGIRIPFKYLIDVFNLNEFEIHCLILGIMPSINRKYEKVFAYIQDDVNAKYPTLDIAIKLYDGKSLFTNPVEAHGIIRNKLEKYFLKENKKSSGSYLSYIIEPYERIIQYIFQSKEKKYDSWFFNVFFSKEEIPRLIGQIDNMDKIRSILKRNDQSSIYVNGENGSGRKLILKHICKEMNSRMILVDSEKLMCTDIKEFESRLNLLKRELLIQQAYICFNNFNDITKNEKENRVQIRRIFEEIFKATDNIFIVQDNQWIYKEITGKDYYEINIKGLQFEERLEIWSKIEEEFELNADVNLSEISNKFKLTPSQIHKAIQWISMENKLNNKRSICKEEIYTACYKQTTDKLKEKATLITRKFSFDDLILPQQQKVQMMQACNYIKYKHVVFEKWGFDEKLPYGRGLNMLFEGPPGTGKTMAATVIANELSLEIYKVDLSQIVSKYIGETEKNLKEIFDVAEKSNCILFFDETDALFGKRSEVKDSHDKYANIETSFLLQKIEEYEGVVLMATNYLQNIDEAFIRRINFIIHFPFPDSESRIKIWRSIIPESMPIDHKVDFDYLGNQFEISGATIKSTIMSAAFMAAEKYEPINMRYILSSLKDQLSKQGKVLLKEDFGEYSMFI